jgi:hypothetical protein
VLKKIVKSVRISVCFFIFIFLNDDMFFLTCPRKGRGKGDSNL